MASGSPAFAKLNGENYSTWSGEMEAWLRASGLWRLVSGKVKAPVVSAAVTEANALDAWEAKLDKAAGWLFFFFFFFGSVAYISIWTSTLRW
jgi:hypothetical protein